MSQLGRRQLRTPALLLGAVLMACGDQKPAASPGTYGGYGNAPNAPYPAQPYGNTPPSYPPPHSTPPTGAAPGASTPPATAPAPPVVNDPINGVDLAWLRQRSQFLIAELSAALAPRHQARLRGIPLVFDDEVGEVNAFAACTSSGKALMAISDGLLDITAHLAQAKANDELFQTQLLPSYIQLIARQQRPGQPIVRPAAGFFPPAQQADPRRVARQHQVLDETLAFILGHELAHHYLGHLPCTAGNLFAAEVGAILAGAVPALGQPAELAADAAGTYNVLGAGQRRADYKLTEQGGLLTMQFFAGIGGVSLADVLFGFERSHPPPQFRQPVIQQAAGAWRSSGGATWPF